MYQIVADLQDIPTRQGRSFSQPAASSASLPSGQLRARTRLCVRILCTCSSAVSVTYMGRGTPKLSICLVRALA